MPAVKPREMSDKALVGNLLSAARLSWGQLVRRELRLKDMGKSSHHRDEQKYKRELMRRLKVVTKAREIARDHRYF